MTSASDDARPRPRRYRGHLPEERRAERRRKLLAAGLALFTDAGYANTSVERICSTAGVTGRHFYEEFSSREQLLQAVYDDIVETAFALVRDQVAAAPPGLEARLDAGVAAYMHALLDDPRHARIVIVESLGVSAELDQHRRETGSVFTAFIEHEAATLLAEGVPLRGTPFTTLALVAAIHELTVAWLAAPEPPPIDELVAEGVRIITAVALYDPAG